MKTYFSNCCRGREYFHKECYHASKKKQPFHFFGSINFRSIFLNSRSLSKHISQSQWLYRTSLLCCSSVFSNEVLALNCPTDTLIYVQSKSWYTVNSFYDERKPLYSTLQPGVKPYQCPAKTLTSISFFSLQFIQYLNSAQLQ